MSAAATAEAVPPAKGKKKLIILIAVAALVLAGGGGAAVLMMKKKASAEAEAGDGEAAADGHAPAQTAAKHDPKAVPVFVPLDPFTVNLADREAERYAQIGITLEIDDAKTGEQLKVYMPAVRNNILMAIADRTAGELLGRDGKTKLSEKIKREASRALGYEIEDDDEADTAAHAAPAKAEGAAGKKKKKKRGPAPPLPVRAVHFSNFIIQ